MFVPVEQLAGKSIGQHTLTKLIGRSALSAVYEAATSEQASPVMLTVFRLPDECVGDAWELFMERFEDEAARLRVLQHPNVVPYYEFGEEFGYPYLITPLTSNQTLVDILKQSVCTPVQMLHLLKQIAAGLDYIHGYGIVHGSLKPSNILLRAEQSQPRVLIANVGLTQILEMRGVGEVSHSHPHLFSVAGTLLTNPAYLAPEVVQGAPSDVRSDMYALGILIYEMLCGRPPFTGSDPIAVALQHVNQPIPPLQSLRPELPQALDGALRSVLERDPARRILQAEKLVTSLEGIIKTLQESSKGAPERQSGMMGKGSLTPHSAQAEQQWQGMPGVTGDKMPSLVPEFIAGSAGMTRRSAHGQFKLPSSGSLPPVPPAATPVGSATSPHSGQIFKPPMRPAGVPASTSQTVQSTAGASLFKSAQAPVQQNDQLVTVIASGPRARLMLPTTQSPAVQNASPFVAPVAPAMADSHSSQMAGGQQYNPLQASPAQMPDTNYAGWAQAGNVEIGVPPNAGMQGMYNDPQYTQQAGAMYNDPQYTQQAGAMYNDPQYAQQGMYNDRQYAQQAGAMYTDPQYAQQGMYNDPQYAQQYMDQYRQDAWVQHEQELEPGPDQGRRRATLIVGGAVVAAVLGAGGIDLLRMMKNRNNSAAIPATNNNQTQTAPPAATMQQAPAQPTPAPANKKAATVIADQKKLAINTAQDFTNPIDNHPAILVHLPDGKFAAYDNACTHQGVAVAYDPQTNKLVCPLHHSIFDPADNGKVLKGPAFLRLPAVPIQVNGDGTITAG